MVRTRVLTGLWRRVQEGVVEVVFLPMTPTYEKYQYFGVLMIDNNVEENIQMSCCDAS